MVLSALNIHMLFEYLICLHLVEIISHTFRVISLNIIRLKLEKNENNWFYEEI